ncbi:MAG: EAL domain-containing protein [Desulfofustis sp.]|nr:EAL domain-containing protein [Desulfofustis sp.]
MSITPTTRISLGLVSLTISLLILGKIIGLAPDRTSAVVDSRKTLSEALAIQFSAAVQHDDLALIRKTLESMVERENDIQSAAIRDARGDLIAETGNHTEYWESPGIGKSTATHIQVPIYKGQMPWATVEISFPPLWFNNIVTGFRNSYLSLILFIGFTGFAGYFLLIKRTLRELDPSKVIPDRVQAAFDVLKEGVLILDENEQIVLANKAFAEMMNCAPTELIGFKGSELGWEGFRTPKQKKKLPWNQVLKGKSNMIGVRLSIKREKLTTLTMIANCAPVQDDKGRSRGVLVTLDNVTELEMKNEELSSVINKLQKTTNVVQTKNKELEFLATRDPLTHLLNRRALNQRFEKIFKEAQESGDELSCVMCDIDHFKLVNDRYGHASGDEVLKAIAGTMQRNFREHDQVGRYGGEEFCIVLPAIDIRLAEKICDRIRKSIEEDSSTGIQVTMSFGISALSESVNSPEELANHADRALYIAKESGRNQVVCWGDDEIFYSSGKEIDLEHPSKKDGEVRNSPDANPDSSKQAAINDDGKEVERLTVRVRELEVLAQKRGKELEHFASFDVSTGLPRRALFQDRASQAILRGQRFDTIVAVLSISVDNVQQVSETIGHESGELLLKTIGKRLIKVLRSMDTVALLPSESFTPTISRLNQENFGILLTDIEDVSSITWIVKRILKALEERCKINDHTIYPVAYVGIAICPHDGETSAELERKASAAKTHAIKSLGANRYHFYSQNVHNISVQHWEIESRLHQAIENDEFELHYQPKINTSDGAIIGFEALLRLDSPKQGSILPGQFIPVAEYAGLIGQIGEWVLRTACSHLRELIDMGFEDYCSVAINVSNRQFRNSDFARSIQDALKENLLFPENIIVEVTENSMMESIKSSKLALQEIQRVGVCIALDDFGTGYSSLGYLKHFPITHLKVDRSFVADIEASQQAVVLVESLIHLAHSMGLKVTAEGVENEAQAKILFDLNCDEMQGFFFGRPIPHKKLTALLKQGVGERFQLWNSEKAA